MRAFDSYLLLLPSGAGGHARDAGRLRLVAERHGYDGWLLGCREMGLRHGRRRVGVTPLMVLGTPSGTIGTALASAGVLHGCEYVLTDAPAAGLERPWRHRPAVQQQPDHIGILVCVVSAVVIQSRAP